MIVNIFAFLLGALTVFVLMALWVDRLKARLACVEGKNKTLWHELRRREWQCDEQAMLLESRWHETTKERMG